MLEHHLLRAIYIDPGFLERPLQGQEPWGWSHQFADGGKYMQRLDTFLTQAVSCERKLFTVCHVHSFVPAPRPFTVKTNSPKHVCNLYKILFVCKEQRRKDAWLFRTAHHCFRAYGGGGSQIKANSIFTRVHAELSVHNFCGPTGGFVTWVPIISHWKIYICFFPGCWWS